MVAPRLPPLVVALAVGCLLVGLLGCTQAAIPPRVEHAQANEDLIAKGREWTRAFYDGKTKEMWNDIDGPLEDVLKNESGLDAFREDSMKQLGREVAVVEGRIEEMDKSLVYVRIARYERRIGLQAPVRILRRRANRRLRDRTRRGGSGGSPDR